MDLFRLINGLIKDMFGLKIDCRTLEKILLLVKSAKISLVSHSHEMLTFGDVPK